MHRWMVVAVMIAVGGFGCRRDTQAPERVASSATKTLDPGKDLTPLVARLEYEASHRLPVAVTAEHVLDALDRAELRVTNRRQFLGITMNASYCLGGTTHSGVAVAACEYPSAEEATAGKAFMDLRYGAMAPAARRAVRATTVLTISGSEDALITRALDVFAAL